MSTYDTRKAEIVAKGKRNITTNRRFPFFILSVRFKARLSSSFLEGGRYLNLHRHQKGYNSIELKEPEPEP
uniref:Uncharacterized protein n=1 Tax=Salix viminalis TaxID=40686 RepID=A0A6N2MU46_SALVM